MELARSVGATLVLDVTQSAGVVPLDAPALGVDVLVSSGYKWLCSAPGAGICYLRPELWERLDPPFVGWKSTEDAFAFDATTIPLAQRGPPARVLDARLRGRRRAHRGGRLPARARASRTSSSTTSRSPRSCAQGWSGSGPRS